MKFRRISDEEIEEDKKEEEDSENKEDSNESSVNQPYKLTGSLELDMNFSTPIKYKSSEDTRDRYSY